MSWWDTTFGNKGLGRTVGTAWDDAIVDPLRGTADFIDKYIFGYEKKEAPPEQKPLTPPKRADVSTSAIATQVQDLARRRGQNTNLTGGTGLLDQPTTASTVLLGM